MITMSRKRREKIVPVLLVIVFILLSGISLYSISKLQGHARVVNYTGIVRGATQRLIKQELRHLPNDDLIRYLDNILDELTTGKGKNGLVALHDPLYQDLLHQLQVKWKIIKSEIRAVRQGRNDNRLFNESEAYFILADQAVTAAENYSEKGVYRTWQWVIGLNVVFIGLVVLFYFYSSRERKLNEELQAAEKASREKSDFLSRMSHEIRTPLNGIIGMTEIAKMVSTDKPRLEDSLDKIDQSSRFLLALINDILDMARIESGKIQLYRQSFNFLKLIESIKILFHQKAVDNRIDFRVIFHELTVHSVIGDELRIKQIVINLLSNAFKFTPSGGRITLEIKQTFPDEDNVHFTIAVTDTGIGMTEEFMKTMFEPFEQEEEAARHYGGTGLGLAICYNLLKMMNGSIEVASTPGEGSRFVVRFTLCRAPLSALPDESVTEPVSPVTEGSLTDYRILVVEDNLLNAEIVMSMLEPTGVALDHVTDGEQAVETFQRSPPGWYDLILMDVRMPKMDGLTATETIRKLVHPDAATISIIALTANAFKNDLEAGLKSGMNGYLSKPIDAAELYRTVASFLNKKQAGKAL